MITIFLHKIWFFTFFQVVLRFCPGVYQNCIWEPGETRSSIDPFAVSYADMGSPGLRRSLHWNLKSLQKTNELLGCSFITYMHNNHYFYTNIDDYKLLTLCSFHYNKHIHFTNQLTHNTLSFYSLFFSFLFTKWIL